MRIWRLLRPSGSPHAQFQEAAPHEPPPQPSCGVCGLVLRTPRRPPLEIDWHTADGREVADFAWPAGAAVALARTALAEQLRDAFGGFTCGAVTVREHRVTARFKQGSRLSRRLLAAANDLVTLDVATVAPYDPERSTVREVRPPCPGCRRVTFSWEPGIARDILLKPSGSSGLRLLDGGARVELRTWDDELKTIPRIPHERVMGMGLFVAERDLGGAGVFTIPDAPDAILCTDAVRDHLRAGGTANVSFRCVGETISG